MRILLIILSLVFFYHSFAETEQTVEIKTKQSSADKEPEETKPQSKKKNNTADTFNPSEKLSQDVPTAFPVDI